MWSYGYKLKSLFIVCKRHHQQDMHIWSLTNWIKISVLTSKLNHCHSQGVGTVVSKNLSARDHSLQWQPPIGAYWSWKVCASLHQKHPSKGATREGDLLGSKQPLFFPIALLLLFSSLLLSPLLSMPSLSTPPSLSSSLWLSTRCIFAFLSLSLYFLFLSFHLPSLSLSYLQTPLLSLTRYCVFNHALVSLFQVQRNKICKGMILVHPAMSPECQMSLICLFLHDQLSCLDFKKKICCCLHVQCVFERIIKQYVYIFTIFLMIMCTLVVVVVVLAHTNINVIKLLSYHDDATIEINNYTTYHNILFSNTLTMTINEVL